ncbi:hypothetical protein DBY21_02580 [Candidatus Gastranaerophilales bacterium]|nr:MAG: hypothetical protein DBY21_02580 [Candidatus Gastranaerophilales bacterium]
MEFNSIQDFKSNYTHVYHKDVVPLLAPYEKERLKAKRNTGILLVIVFVLVTLLVLSFTGVLSRGWQNEFVLVLLFGGIFVCLMGVVSIGKNFENKLKAGIMPKLMKAFGDFVWTSAEVIDKYTLKDTKIFSRFDYKDNDDSFFGTYKGLTININETELYYYTKDSKGRRQKHTEFKGVIVEIDVKKTFKGHTIIRNRGFFNDRAYQEVKLEDPEFSKLYYVDANDQIESRYLLTPSFMERYKHIKTAFGGSSIQGSFKDNKLILAISTYRDLFKLGNLSRPVSDTKQFTALLNEFISILAIVDELKLNQNIGL